MCTNYYTKWLSLYRQWHWVVLRSEEIDFQMSIAKYSNYYFMCKSFLFFRSLVFLEPYSGFEPETDEWKSPMLPVTPIGQYLPSWIWTKVLLACKASAINHLGEGELVAGMGADPTATKIWASCVCRYSCNSCSCWNRTNIKCFRGTCTTVILTNNIPMPENDSELQVPQTCVLPINTTPGMK